MKNLIKSFTVASLLVLCLGGFKNEAYPSNAHQNFNIQSSMEDNLIQKIVVKGMLVNGQVVPSIELPEIEIAAFSSSEHLVSAKVVNGEVVPFIELEEVEITASL